MIDNIEILYENYEVAVGIQRVFREEVKANGISELFVSKRGDKFSYWRIVQAPVAD